MRNIKISKSITKRSSTLDRYLKDINRYPLLSLEEEVDLFFKINNGIDVEDLKQRVINSNLRFVVSIAKQYQGCGIAIEDIIEEGNIGLLEAVNRFDPTLGFKFISYAVWWIRQSILKVIAEKGRTIKIPLNMRLLIRKFYKSNELMLQKQQRPISVQEFVESEGLDESFVSRLSSLLEPVLSLDSPLKDGEETTIEDIICSDIVNDAEMSSESLSSILKKHLNLLSDVERLVITNYYGIDCDPKSLGEISLMLHKTSERVRQIKYKALKILNVRAGSELKSYL